MTAAYSSPRPPAERPLEDGRTRKKGPASLRGPWSVPFDAGGSGDLLAGLGPVGEEHFEALVGQRVLDQGFQRCRRGGDDVGADEGGLLDVVDRAHRGGEDLRLVAVIVEDLADFADQV